MKNALGQTVRRTPFQRELDEDLETLRDDCIALFLNSKMTQKQVHQTGGPTPGTISKWLYRETKFPQYRTINSFVMALGCQLMIVDRNAQVDPVVRAKVARAGKHRPKMPPKKIVKARSVWNQAAIKP